MELRGVEVSVGTESAGTPYVLPLLLAEPLAAQLVLPASRARTPRLAEALCTGMEQSADVS